MHPPRVAVVGCGHWGRNLVRVLAAEGALGAVVDGSPQGRAAAREIAPGVRTVSRCDAVLADPDIAALVVATPAETHFAVAREALEAGKDAFVEKPLTTEVESARRLVELARERERVLMVGHLLEYHPAILKLQALVREGVLGKLYYVMSNRLNLGKIRSEENALWSFAPHDIAVILRLVGTDPGQVVATGGSYIQPNIADVTVTQLLFDNGVRSHIYVSWLHPFKEQRLVVVGSDRMASYDDISKSLLLYDQRVDWRRGQPVPVRGEGTPVDFPPDEPLVAECRHFLDCVATRRTPLTDGEEGVRVLRVLEAAQRSLVTNGQPVSLGVGGGAGARVP
jgi:predicted dehydrogenase